MNDTRNQLQRSTTRWAPGTVRLEQGKFVCNASRYTY
jgi:hypothetical protein